MQTHYRDRRVLRYLEQAGFYGFFRLGTMRIYNSIMTAFVARWRAETHTFHFKDVGEATVTLQDVGIISGLRVDGQAVIGEDPGYGVDRWQDLLEDLLGIRPPPEKFEGNSILGSWILENFRGLPDDATDEIVRRHTRAVIMTLIGYNLLTDKSGGGIKLMYLPLLRDFAECGRYSWGAAGLACLYRNLCRAAMKDTKEIAGPLMILQV